MADQNAKRETNRTENNMSSRVGSSLASLSRSLSLSHAPLSRSHSIPLNRLLCRMNDPNSRGS